MTRTQNKEKFLKNTIFTKQKKNCAAILDPFRGNVLEFETTSFHNFSPKIPKFRIKKIIGLWEVGANRPLKEWTNDENP